MRSLIVRTILLLALLTSCQPKDEIHIIVGSQRIAFNFIGGEGKIYVYSSVEWNAMSTSDWITIDSTNKTTVFFSVATSHDDATRSARIVISDSDEEHTVLIEQSPPSSNPERSFDSLALVALFKACDGGNWRFGEDTAARPWQIIMPITTWEGVTTAIIDGHIRVVGLNLAGARLKGVIPKEMTDLTAMQMLILSQNEISGNVFSIVSKLPELLFLDLSRNEFFNLADTPAAGSFAKLRHLNLNVIPFHGAIPAWALLPDLIEFSIAGSNIQGAIPAQISAMTNLTTLDLSNNKLSGTIPAELTKLKSLTYLDLATNKLTGNIPSNFGELSSLRVLKTAYNELTGEIPASIAQMRNLNTLNLSGNKFTSFPNEIIKSCDKLKYVDLSFNNIEGGLTADWAALVNLMDFMVLKNRLSGAIPEALLNDSRLNKIWFARSLIYPQQAGYGFSNIPTGKQ